LFCPFLHKSATHGRCEAQGTLGRNPLQLLRVRLLGLLRGTDKMTCGNARSILYFSKDLPCRCGLGKLAQRSGRREVPEKRGFEQLQLGTHRRGGRSCFLECNDSEADDIESKALLVELQKLVAQARELASA
jgi:hypothetical protein